MTTIFTEALIDPKVEQTLTTDLETPRPSGSIGSQTDSSKDYAAVIVSFNVTP